MSPDGQMRSKLPGIWVFEPKFANGHDHKVTITVTVAPDGSSVTTFALPGPREIRMEGTWRIESGYLIDTITKDSQTNASVPRVSRFRIVRIGDVELELEDQEKNPGLAFPTNRIIFRRKQ